MALKRKLVAACLGLFMALPVATAQAEPLAKEYFGYIKSASGGRAMPIGSYAKGCVAGAQQLPETGPTWQAMRLSRNRNWGHPELVKFIERLSQKARSAGWAGLYVGDMSQPRGGPMLSGHASHQIGLDVDIWALPATRLNLSRQERENISSVSMVTSDFRRVNGNFTQAHYDILRAAAKDPAVARIFVTPAVKLKMCEVTSGNQNWLGKIRPWWGHNYHFHVRLKCPSGSGAHCENQTPVPAGDGCDWAGEFYGMHIAKTIPIPKADPNAPAPKPKPPLTLSRLPVQCAALVK